MKIRVETGLLSIASKLRFFKVPSVLGTLGFLAQAPLAHATLLQILHTNDLHSHFEEAEDRTLAGLEPPHAPMGGYAQVKATLDRLKADAASQGIESLVLDAGDFSEGSPYFLADQGEASWRLIDSMGYDAVVMGNHDYLMGQEALDGLVGRVTPKFSLLGANFINSRQLKNLNHYLSPYAEFKKAGVKIAVLGLTTDDLVYTWLAGKNVIVSPQRGLDGYIDDLARRDDYVILLTHIGVEADKKIIKHNTGVDLVVGGHSHTFLDQMVVQRDFNGAPIPIVQAGQHGEKVGRLIVDVQRGRPMVIKSYELVPVMKDGPQDSAIHDQIEKAKQSMNDEFGDQWLHEVIGFSDTPLLRPDLGPSEWGTLMADALKSSVQAELSVDAGGQLFGDNQPAGPITREKLFAFYPGVFSLQEKLGWTIWTTSMRGWVLRSIMEIAMDSGITFNVSGASYRAAKSLGLWHLHDFKIDGEPLHDFKLYTLALPEGIGRAVKEISPILQAWFHSPRDTGIPMWTALENEFKHKSALKQATKRALAGMPGEPGLPRTSEF